jgi:hypothetical protein
VETPDLRVALVDRGEDFTVAVPFATFQNRLATLREADLDVEVVADRRLADALVRVVPDDGRASRRVRVRAGRIFSSALYLDGGSGSMAFTPDHPSFDVTDLDARIALAMNDWTPAAQTTLLGRWHIGTPDRSFFLRVETNGRLTLTWSNNGSASLAAQSTISPVVANGQDLLVRVWLDVDNGASGRDVRFFFKPLLSGSPIAQLDDLMGWSQLGTTVTQAGTSSIFAGAAAFTVGARENTGTFERLAGRVRAALVKDGPNGATVTKIDFTDLPTGTRQFVDVTGKAYSLSGGARIEAA